MIPGKLGRMRPSDRRDHPHNRQIDRNKIHDHQHQDQTQEPGGRDDPPPLPFLATN